MKVIVISAMDFRLKRPSVFESNPSSGSCDEVEALVTLRRHLTTD